MGNKKNVVDSESSNVEKIQHWCAGLAVKASAGARKMFNVDQTIEQYAEARADIKSGKEIDAGYHAVSAVLSASGGLAKAVKIVASEIGYFTPVVGSAIASAVPGSPLRVASMAWKFGGEEVKAIRLLRAGQKNEARFEAAKGFSHVVVSLGAMAIAAGAAGLAMTVAPAAAPFVAIGVGMAFTMEANKALARVGDKLKARAASKSQSALPEHKDQSPQLATAKPKLG
jgi:hypothetical protein